MITGCGALEMNSARARPAWISGRDRVLLRGGKAHRDGLSDILDDWLEKRPIGPDCSTEKDV